MRIQTTALALALWPVLAFASQTGTNTQEKPTGTQEKPTAMTNVHDPCFVHKGSDLLGSNVKNPQGEGLGDIKDLVINPESGEIEYAVLSFGGFLGMGDKLFALPWGVLQPVHDKSGDQKYLLLSVDKERLKNSPGFPKDNWPDMTSADWAKSIRDFYKEDLEARREGMGEAEMPKANKAIEASGRYNLVKVSDIKGTNVKTSDGKDAGEIGELGIDPNRGRVAFFILSSGGFLGFGKDKYILPWQAAQISVDEDKDLVAKLTVPQAKFEKAPDYTDDWKRMNDPVYMREVYTFYEAPVYWKDVEPMEAGSRKP